MKKKIVVNSCFGGFGLSAKALEMYYELKNPGKKLYFYRRNFLFDSRKPVSVYTKVTDLGKSRLDAFSEDKGESFTYSLGDSLDNMVWEDNLVTSRHDPDLVKVIETLGPEVASGDCADLKIIEVPEGVMLYRIDEYDGMESVEFYPGDGWINLCE